MKNLGHIDPKALELFQSNFSESHEFSEGTENYDFARCQRPDGSIYGTRGQCRKGKDVGAKSEESKAAPKAKAKRKVADEKREERRLRDKELLMMGREKAAARKVAKTELKKVEKGVDSATRKAKRDPSKENKEALKVQLRRLREQERAIAKLDREMDKIIKERARIRDQNEKERMTPAQRAEQRRIEKVIKERG